MRSGRWAVRLRLILRNPGPRRAYNRSSPHSEGGHDCDQKGDPDHQWAIRIDDHERRRVPQADDGHNEQVKRGNLVSSKRLHSSFNESGRHNPRDWKRHRSRSGQGAEGDDPETRADACRKDEESERTEGYEHETQENDGRDGPEKTLDLAQRSFPFTIQYLVTEKTFSRLSLSKEK